MAILVNTTGEISNISYDRNISDAEIPTILGQQGYTLNFVDMGIYILVYSDMQEMELPINTIVSLAVHEPIYGSALLLTGNELSPDSIAQKTFQNCMYNEREANEGIRILLSKTIETVSRVLDIPLVSNLDDGNNDEKNTKQQNTIYFDVDKMISTMTDDDEAHLTKLFDSIISALSGVDYEDWEQTVLQSGPGYNIYFKQGEVDKTMKTLMDFFLLREEYERCMELSFLTDRKKKSV